MVHRGYAYIGHIFSKGFSVVDVRDPANPKTGEVRRRRRRTPGACISRPMTTCCSSSTTRTCSRSPSSPTRRPTTRARSTITPRQKSTGAQLVGRPRRLRHLQARRPEADRLHAGRGHRPASPLVRRRPLGLCLGAARRLLRLHPDHHRHAGPEEAEARRQILAARHERRRRREGQLADQERPLRPAPRHHPRRHRLLHLARRLPRGGRRQGPGQPEADRPQELGAALRRRHAQRPAAARPQSADRRRRDGARQSGGRLQADLGVRQPGEVEPDQHLDLPGALGQGLPARSAAISARTMSTRTGRAAFSQLGADLRDLPERRHPGLRHPRPVPAEGGRRLRAAAAEELGRPAPEPADRPPLGRRLRRQERRSATPPTSAPGSTSSNTRGEVRCCFRRVFRLPLIPAQAGTQLFKERTRRRKGFPHPPEPCGPGLHGLGPRLRGDERPWSKGDTTWLPQRRTYPHPATPTTCA